MSRAKGNRTQAKGFKLGDSWGYFVHTNGHSRYGTKSNYPGGEHSKDCFGLFDAIFVKNGEVLFVQYTTNRFHPFKPYIEWCKSTKTKALLLAWFDRKGFKVKRIDKDGTLKTDKDYVLV